LDLAIALEERGDAVIFHLSGQFLSSGSIKKFREEAMSVMGRNNKFFLDMENLVFLNSALIGEIIRFCQLLKTSGGAICICCANKLVMEFLKMASVDRIIPIFESLALATAWLEKVKDIPENQ
jgi:anti-anti-sigma factor